MRILALDVGDARIGIAVSDELEMGAYPLSTYHRQGSLKRDVTAVAAIAVEQEADCVLVGLPLSIDGGEGRQAHRTRIFGNALARALGQIPLVYRDESLTSVEAEEQLIDMDYSRAKRRSVLDQWAAKILLDGYLESRRAAGRPVHSLDEDERGGRELASPAIPSPAPRADPPRNGEGPDVTDKGDRGGLAR